MHDQIEKIKRRLKVGSYCFQMLCHLEQGGTLPVWEDNHVRYSMPTNQNLYQQAAAEIIAKHLPCVDNWKMYSFAKQAYQQKIMYLAFNEFEFCCACRAFENHFVNGKGV